MDGVDVRGDVRRFQEEVVRMQIEIWRDRMERLGVLDKGRLRDSVTGDLRASGDGAAMVFAFISYGIYQDRGTGRGYVRGNGGDLPFLGKAYRAKHGLDKPRKRGPAWGGGMTSGEVRERRPWFSRAWWVTQQVVREGMVRLIGDAYKGQFSEIEALKL